MNDDEEFDELFGGTTTTDQTTNQAEPTATTNQTTNQTNESNSTNQTTNQGTNGTNGTDITNDDEDDEMNYESDENEDMVGAAAVTNTKTNDTEPKQSPTIETTPSITPLKKDSTTEHLLSDAVDKYEPMFPGSKEPLVNPKIVEKDLDEDFEDHPWRRPGDIEAYFNYGFNEDTWKSYCSRQNEMRLKSSMSRTIRVFEGFEQAVERAQADAQRHLEMGIHDFERHRFMLHSNTFGAGGGFDAGYEGIHPGSDPVTYGVSLTGSDRDMEQRGPPQHSFGEERGPPPHSFERGPPPGMDHHYQMSPIHQEQTEFEINAYHHHEEDMPPHHFDERGGPPPGFSHHDDHHGRESPPRRFDHGRESPRRFGPGFEGGPPPGFEGGFDRGRGRRKRSRSAERFRRNKRFRR